MINYGGNRDIWKIEVDQIPCYHLLTQILGGQDLIQELFVGSSPWDLHWTLWSDQSNFRRKFDVLIIKGGVHR